MKKTWITILAFSANLAAFAQGQVNFNTRVPYDTPPVDGRIQGEVNFSTHVTTDVPPVDARILNPDGTGCTDGFGQLFILNSDESLAPLVPIGAFRKTEAGAGYINAGGAYAPVGFPPGTTVTMILRAWRGEPGSTYDSATWKGQSEPITITFAGRGFLFPPVPPGDLIGLKGFTLVPEPTTLALGGAGLGLLLLRRRK